MLTSLGVADPQPVVSQVVQGDLDGDGAAEVLVVADRLSDREGLLAGDGDYSVAFLRRVVGGSVETTIVASSVADAVPDETPVVEVFRVAAFADLNGDGRMEVVIDSRHYEGSAWPSTSSRPTGR